MKHFQFIILFFLCSIFSSVHASNQHDSNDQYEKALQAYYNGETEKAYIYVKNTLQAEPNFIAGKILLAKILIDNQYYADAVTTLKEALSAGGDIELIISLLSEAWYHNKQYKELIAFKLKKTISSVEKAKWYIYRAKAYGQLKDNEQQASAYEKALLLAPKHPDILNEVAIYHVLLQQPELAQALITKSLMLDNSNPQTWHIQGQIHNQKNNNQAATTTFLKVLTLEPEYVDAQRSIAKSHINQKSHKQALVYLDKVLSESPNDLRAMLLKANVLLENGQVAEAKLVLNALNNKTSLISKNDISDNHWVLFINGTSAFLLNKYEIAIRDLTNFLNKNPDNFYAVGLIANAYIKLEQLSYARDILDKHRKQVIHDIDLSVTLADLYLKTNRLLRCDELIQQLNSLYPNSVQVALVKARLLHARDQNAQAIAFLEEKNTTLNDVDIKSYLVDLYMRSNQSAKAANLLNQLISLHPNNIELLNAMSAALIQLELYPQAHKVIQHVLSIDKDYFPAKYNYTSILLANKQPNQAVKLAQNLIKVRPRNINAHMLLAKSFIALGDSKAAISALHTLVRIDKSHIKANELLVALYKLTGQYEQALSQINYLLNKNRLSPAYLQIKAEIYLQLDDIDSAKKQFNKLSNLWHNDADSLVNLSDLQRRANLLPDARKSINRAIELAPKSTAVAYQDTKLSIFESDKQQSQKKLSTLKKSVTGNDEVISLEGDYLTKNGQLIKAQQRYLQAFSLNPKNGLTLVKAYNLAKLNILKEEFETLLKNTLEKQQNNFYYRNLLADFYLHEQRYLDAKEHYLRIKDLKKLPNKANVLNNLAYASLNDDLDSALLYAKEAAQLNNKSASVLDTYGWVLAQKESFDEALRVLRQAQSISARTMEISYHLAYTLHKLGRNKEAVVELKKVAASNKNFDGKAEALALLETLSKS